MPSAIAWIAPNYMAYNSAVQYLNTTAVDAVWSDDAPTDPLHDPLNDPRDYTYCHHVAYGHTIYLACANNKQYIPRLATIMVKELKAIGIDVRMFLLGDADYLESYPDTTAGLGDCFLGFLRVDNDYFMMVRELIRQEFRRNAARLLTAVDRQAHAQARTLSHIYPLYDPTQADIEGQMCGVTCFNEQPVINILGLYEMGNLSQIEYAYGVAAETIINILKNLEPLEM